MSLSNAGPGGVRNLRAMFENKAGDQSNSPPSRGRSPNGSVSSFQDRPLEKIKTSFVAVEKASEEEQSQQNLRKLSDITMDETTGNEKAVHDNQGLGEILKGSPFMDNSEFDEGVKQRLEPNGVANRAAAMAKKIQEGNTDPLSVHNSADSIDEPKIPAKEPPPSGLKAPAGKVNLSTDATRSPSEPKGPVVKPRGGVAKIKGVMESAARAREINAAAAKEAKSAGTPKAAENAEYANNAEGEITSAIPASKPKSTIPKPQPGADSNSKTRGTRVVSSAGPAPRPESTKPYTASKAPRMSLPRGRLPAAATAPTASSVAKTEEVKPVESRHSEKKVTGVPPRVAKATTASTLAKKSSRASLNNSEGAKSKPITKPADEGFLARMMRPTASSAQKAHEKVHVSSPPRPKESSAKTLTTRPSRKSLSQVDDDKENETTASELENLPQETEEHLESTEPQPAEPSSTT